jgi:hypothetical protein
VSGVLAVPPELELVLRFGLPVPSDASPPPPQAASRKSVTRRRLIRRGITIMFEGLTA